MATNTNKQLPSSLMADLHSTLLNKTKTDCKSAATADPNPEKETSSEIFGTEKKRPIVLVTNGEGIHSPGLGFLVEALVRGGIWDVHVCAPESDKCFSSHSITAHETLVATSEEEFTGATAFSISGSPVDCVSLVLSGAIFSSHKPDLVISGIERGLNCGNLIFYSGAVAAAREALLYGVPSLSISFDWKNGESQESDLKVAADHCMPLIYAVIRDIEKGVFPKDYALNIGIPSSPSTNKGFKVTKQSQQRCQKTWQVVPSSRHSSGAHQFMPTHQRIGIQLAQLSQAASAAGAARRVAAQRKDIEVVESVAAPGKPETKEVVKRLFRLELLQKEHTNSDEGVDLKALENGYICVTPLHLQWHYEPKIHDLFSNWLSSAVNGEKYYS
ncbi:5'-nucleotidase SurE [Rhynchospora pubera]|uniref:5'-nucleotidase SurE n=1 Tax=Rhynchospora pubera TaxID=906938 RepID=A0AAV8F8I7_9POAL|nr:5'-nucleotidase SurE [Rhynchospora pubera]